MALALDLFVEVTNASGKRFKWNANEAPRDRPQNLSFGTKIGEGFSDGTLTLSRRIDQDYPDLELVNDAVITGADGSIAYEGRVSAMPRDLAESHSISVTLAGWMAHAKDTKFTEVYVDRDLSAWGAASRARKTTQLVANQTPSDAEQTTDPTDSTAGVTTHLDGAWASPYTIVSEAWYDAGPGLTIGKIAYSWKRESTTIDPALPNWFWAVYASSDDKFTATVGGTNLKAAGPSVAQVFTPSSAYRYAVLGLTYTATPGGADGARYAIDWYNLAVYGSHGLTTYPGESGQPDGVTASDVIRDIAERFCPLLNTAGVQDSGYVIQHLTFKDRAFPYDAFLQVNKYHLWHLGVWDNKTLCFRPYELEDYDWEIRTDDPGTTFNPQGPSVDDLFNGIVVQYTDLLTGVVNVLRPDVNPDLADSWPENPWNKRGVNHWDEIELSTPTTAAQALQIGKMALGDRNRPRAPGTIAVKGYVKDRRGNDQPAWKVRAGDTISVTNFPNDTPRLIVETRYDDDTKVNTLAIDKPFQALDALLDRVGTALNARGLS